MTFLTKIYQQLEENSVVDTTEDFSRRFLKRSPSYYRSIKAQKRDGSDEVLGNLITTLNAHNNLTRGHTGEHQVMRDWLARCEDIERQVADEIASRAVDNGMLKGNALGAVIRALQGKL